MKSPTLTTSDREATLRRAIIRAIPEYYAWPETEQERYRLSVPKEQDFLIRQALLNSLFGIDVDTEEGLNEVLKGFDDEQYLLLNSTLLLFRASAKMTSFSTSGLLTALGCSVSRRWVTRPG